MSTPEEKERRRQRMKRSAVVRDLHSTKYRARVIPDRRRNHHFKEVEDDALESIHSVDDEYPNDSFLEPVELNNENSN